jgi:hypothetical protein
MASFQAGPCPVFTGLTSDGHTAQAFTNSADTRIGLVGALASVARRWKQRFQPRPAAIL